MRLRLHFPLASRPARCLAALPAGAVCCKVAVTWWRRGVFPPIPISSSHAELATPSTVCRGSTSSTHIAITCAVSATAE
eukprot:365296-Chlamydomonas_euryale.AAC.23